MLNVDFLECMLSSRISEHGKYFIGSKESGLWNQTVRVQKNK
jgi:hypothetical protein